MVRAFARRGAMAIALTLSCTASISSAQNVSQKQFDALIVDARAEMLVDPAAALAIARSADRRAGGLPDTSARDLATATSKWLEAEALNRLNNLDAATPLVAEALSTINKADPNSKLKGEILLTSGSISGTRGQVAKSLEEFQSAYAIFSRLKDNRNTAVSLICIALLYSNANDYIASIKYLKQASEAYSGDKNMLLSIYNNTGGSLQDLGRLSEAEEQYQKALLIARNLNSPILEAHILTGIARVRLKRGDTRHAALAVEAAMELTSSGDAITWRPQVVAIAAQVALQQHDYVRARMLIAKRFDGIDPTTTTLAFREAHQTAYQTYRALGDTDQALIHLAALKRLDDKATTLATTASTALMAARFDFANQELRITKLRYDEGLRAVAFERARAQTQRYMFLGGALATAIVIGLLVFALVTSRRSRLRVDAANEDLAQTNTALGKALAAKTEFLATTSHEIRTPLNGILGMTQVMLADASIRGDTRDRLGIVHGAGITMRALVDDILDVAKMETGNLTIERAPFDLAATIRDATRLWEDQAAAKGIAFSRDLDRCPRMIEGDAARVRQIVFNLLSNALKFTPQGSIDLVVEAHGADQYRIAIGDTGIGIPADKTAEIFESFRQADAGTTRQFGGTGLGLAICRNLARAMGGEISVDSTVGRGSTFAVLLPLEHAAAPVACQTVGQGGPGILIVDRNPISRAMLRALLAPQAGTVAFASSAAEATGCLRAMTVAQVLIDDATIRAEADPLAALERLAAVAQAHDVRTALLWPAAAVRETSDVLATGIDLVIAKPVSGAALVDQLFGSSKPAIEQLVSHAA